jgi:16S rRNA processing protein RimM
VSESGLVVVGQIAGAFGVKGEVRIRSFTEDPEACFGYGPLMDAKGAVILTPVRARQLNQDYGVTTKEQRQREEWEDLKGTLLHVPRAAMPATEDNEFYVADLIGMAVIHTDGRELGTVKAVHNFGAGELVEITPASGEAFMLPFSDAAFPDVDVGARKLTASPEEELLPEQLQRQRSDGGTN